MADDSQSEYGATWYCGVTPLSPPRAPLNHDLDVDVCIIGGGLAGLAVAREVARRGWSVALLEARRIAWNASGRNSGHVLPGYSAQIERIIERIGLPAAKALWQLSQSGVHDVRETIAEIGDVGIIDGKGYLEVFKKPDAERALSRVRLFEQEMGIAVEAWPMERVRDVLKTSCYFEAIHFPYAFQINPLAYALRLADAAEQAGVRIFENTRAVAVDLAGVRKRIETAHGRVRAAHVVLAGNVHLGSVARRLSDTLVPITAFTGVTRPLGKRLAEAVTFRGAVSDSRYAEDHYRIVGGDRLLWSGSASFGSRSRWTQKWLERALCTTYPQLGRVQFDYFWPAEMGHAVHRMPQIGELKAGVWLASAFGGQGLNTCAMAGRLIARAIAEGDDTWRSFLPFELVWAGGRLGRAAVRATAWWRRRQSQFDPIKSKAYETINRRTARLRHKLKKAPVAGIDPAVRPIEAPQAAGGAHGGRSENPALRPARGRELI
jgi:gamma-glutamylputrescine oxidase